MLPCAHKAKIFQDSATYFATKGFAASTRDLANHMGITQALLYRYFASKEELIDQVFQTVFIDRWKPGRNNILAGQTLTVEARLIRIYTAFLCSINYVSLRLLIRAALDGMKFTPSYTFFPNDRILQPVTGGLRNSLGLPCFDAMPSFDDERELVVMVHDSMVFSSIRKIFTIRTCLIIPASWSRCMLRTFYPARHKPYSDCTKRPCQKNNSGGASCFSS